jgi:hypothetical protein
MIKNTLIALVAAAAIVGVAAPAMADNSGAAFGSGSSESREFTADNILVRLQQQGINATGVEEWGNLVRAYVTLEDGTQVMQLYTPGSLDLVTL